PIRDEQGRVTGCVLIFRDISDRRLVEREHLRQVDAASFLVSIIENSEDAVIGVSLDGKIQTWNNAAERLYGYTAAEAVGQSLSILIPTDRKDEEDRLIARILAGERISHFDTVRCDRHGKGIPVSLTISPVRDHDGRIVGTSKIVRDITEAKEAERRIYTLMSELREADARKDEFLAILAHELRGPLAPIRHRLEILKLAGDNPPLRKESIEKADQQLSQLVRLVDDLLDVSRITRNKLELRREQLELGDIISQAIEVARQMAEAQDHKVVVSVPMQSMKVDADPVRLAQIFGNLLQNAHKYSDPGATIWLSAERIGSEVQVSVRDTGIGIAPELLPRIFDLFTQARSRAERAQGGLGIGLTLVRQLVGMHGGSIEARSEGLGKGSEFIVRLPLATAKTAVAMATPMGILQGMPVRRVLVVDDNSETADSLVVLLKLLGHETESAYDGLTAIELAEQFGPDVVLLDIGLPKLNGYEVCQRIRQQPWGQRIVMAAVSGWGQEADRRKSTEAGFDYHMVKPLDYNLLLRVLADSATRST
ncbi:MAG TPA: PAS domain S-box protein, partial [Gemmatimonadales bacterium]|nr:PAS domain S-box protein [Gemmatimonadales bacterium]